jgi:hypothetical protein
MTKTATMLWFYVSNVYIRLWLEHQLNDSFRVIQRQEVHGIRAYGLVGVDFSQFLLIGCFS